MTQEEVEADLDAAERRVREEAIQALGSPEAVTRYERLRRQAERSGPAGNAAFEALQQFENGLTEDQRRLLFGDPEDPRLEPEELEEIRKAFEPALLAEHPDDLYAELRRNLSKVSPERIAELFRLSGTDISKNLMEIVAAIRVREATIRLRAFGVSDTEILAGVLRDFLRQGVEKEDAWFMVRSWITVLARPPP